MTGIKNIVPSEYFWLSEYKDVQVSSKMSYFKSNKLFFLILKGFTVTLTTEL